MGYIRADYDGVKNILDDIVGEEIIIVEPISKRGKKVSKVATLEKTFRDFFRVTFEDDLSMNYNYVDILTKDIKVQLYDGDDFKPLKVPRPLTKKETIPSLKMDDEMFADMLLDEDFEF